MGIDESFRRYVEDLFAPHGRIRTKPMMGGLMIWESGAPFALVTADAEICLKADEEASQEWESAGAERFMRMPYWRVPPDVLDDRSRFDAWARRAIEIGHRTAARRSKP